MLRALTGESHQSWPRSPWEEVGSLGVEMGVCWLLGSSEGKPICYEVVLTSKIIHIFSSICTFYGLTYRDLYNDLLYHVYIFLKDYVNMKLTIFKISFIC